MLITSWHFHFCVWKSKHPTWRHLNPKQKVKSMRYSGSKVLSSYTYTQMVAMTTSRTKCDSKALVPKLHCTLESPGGLTKTHISWLHPRISDLIGLIQPKILIFNKFPDDVDSDAPETTI